MMNSPSPHQQKQVLDQIEKCDDYLQVLDAGELMFGMFVASNENLYAYLGASEEPMWNISSTEDIEDVISRSIGPGDGLDAMHLEYCPVVEHYCSVSFADMHVSGKTDMGEVQSDDTSDNESTKTGRLTPNRKETDDHYAMSK